MVGVDPNPVTTIQMNAGQGLEVRVFSTFSGTYFYRVHRNVGGTLDFLGEWNQESDKSHDFAAFSEPHSYRFYFSWNHPTIDKTPVADESESGNTVTILYKYNAFEFVRLKLTRV